MKRVLFIVTALVLSISVFGQAGPNPGSNNNPDTKGLIKGRIVDQASGTNMEYTSIAVYSLKDSSLISGTVTNQQGQFIIEDLPFGDYYVELNFVGYEKKTISPVKIQSGSRAVDFGTVELNVNRRMLEGAEIVADQRRVEYKLDKKVVNVGEDLNAASGSAVDVLENTPSVSVDIEGNVTLRGSSSFTVLINGKPTVLEGADALRQIPASNIQNIEIITNPSVKFDPDGNGGIVNVVLKKQVEKGTTGIVNASVGMNHKYRFDALFNQRVGKFNYFLGGSYSDTRHGGDLHREHISYPEDGTMFTNIADGQMIFGRGGAQLKTGFDYDFSNKTNLAFELSGGEYTFIMDRSNTSHEFTTEGVDDRYFVNTNETNRKGLYYSANMNFTHKLDSLGQQIVAMGNFSQRKGDELSPLYTQETFANYTDLIVGGIDDRLQNIEDENGYEYRLQLDYTKPISGFGKFEAGYQLRIDDNVEDYTAQVYDKETKEYVTLGENSSEILFFRNIQSAYAQAGGEIGGIQIQAGLRGEYTHRLIEYTNFDNDYEIDRFDWYPSLHIAKQFDKDRQVMMSYSKRINRPRGYHLDSIPNYLDQNTIRIGNPNLSPEYVHSFELGFQQGWGKNFAAFEAYYRNTINPMERITKYEDGYFYQMHFNADEDYSAGGEVMLNWQFAKWLKMNASTNVYYYRIDGEIEGEDISEETVRWDANANATFTITPTTRFQANYMYRGPSITIQGESEGMYFVNLALRQDFLQRKLSATLQLSNLMGSMKREFTAVGDDFSQYVLMQREARIVTLSLSYRINNYKVDPRKQGQQGDGMDMDSGF